MTAPEARRRARYAAAWRSGPLSVPAFRLLSVGQFASTVGDYCYAVALPWLVLSGHGSTTLLGTLLACYGVPRAALIPAGGVLADRLSPRATMLAADTARCAFLVVFTVLAARHTVSLTVLGPLAALVGAGEGLFIPASFSVLPALLDPARLTAGNAFFGAAQQAGSLLGPALGGALVAAAGSAPAFGVDAATFAISALTLAFIPGRPGGPAPANAAPANPAPANPDPANPDPANADGQQASKEAIPASGVLTLLRTSRPLQVVLLLVLAANLTSGGLSSVALPALAHDRWDASGYGALLACLAAGSIAGTLTAARSGGLRRPAVVATLVFTGMALASAVTPFAGGLVGAAAALLVMGAGNGLGNTIMIPRMQMAFPPRMLGRVMSALMFCAMGSFPLSVAVTGVIVRHLGPAAFFPIDGGVVVAAALIGLSQREWRDFGARSRTPDDPAPDRSLA
jgi:hypothetical protein